MGGHIGNQSKEEEDGAEGRSLGSRAWIAQCVRVLTLSHKVGGSNATLFFPCACPYVQNFKDLKFGMTSFLH